MSRSLERWIGALAIGAATAGVLIFFASLQPLPFDARIDFGEWAIVFEPKAAFVIGLPMAVVGASVAFGVYLSQREDW